MTFNDKALEGDMRDRQVFLINYGKPIITCKSIPAPPQRCRKGCWGLLVNSLELGGSFRSPDALCTLHFAA